MTRFIKANAQPFVLDYNYNGTLARIVQASSMVTLPDAKLEAHRDATKMIHAMLKRGQDVAERHLVNIKSLQESAWAWTWCREASRQSSLGSPAGSTAPP